MKILLFGHSGLLGQELQKISSNIVCSNQIDIYDHWTVEDEIDEVEPDIIINAAAQTDSTKIVDNPIKAIRANIIGAANIAMACFEREIRYVYISTDYVYAGEGNHTEYDPMSPCNLYAWTKLGGESSAVCLDDFLIIRTSFGSSKFPYEVAFVNQYTSKDYVDVIAPMILKAAISDMVGCVNIGTEKKTIYEYAKKRNPKVIPAERDIEFDHSLNTDKYKLLLDKYEN